MSEAGDEHLGAFVYCRQHVGPHSTGWCTVDVEDKFPLKATNREAARIECRNKGWRMYGEENETFAIIPDRVQ